MAKRKRSKPTPRSRAKRPVSRSKIRRPRKSTHANAKRKSKPRSTRKNGGNARKTRARSTRGKARSSASRKPAARVRKTRKRFKRITPRFSDAARRPGETAAQYTRRLEHLLRVEREVTAEITRTPTQRARSHRFVDVTQDQGSIPDIPSGFQPVGTGTGRAIGDINELTVGLDEIDWEHFDVDWDDIFDDVGDEDADLYGEDAG